MSPAIPSSRSRRVRVDHQSFEDPFARFVVRDQVSEVVALRSRILGVAADVEIEAGAVVQEDVTASSPRHHAPEQVARYLVGRQPPLPVKGAGEAVFSLDSENPPVHTPQATCLVTGVTLETHPRVIGDRAASVAAQIQDDAVQTQTPAPRAFLLPVGQTGLTWAGEA